MEIIFNINNAVKVKLTDYGINHWLNTHNNGLPFKYHYTKDKLLKKMDNDGYWVFQLWDLMSIFGSSIFMGNPDNPFIGNNIVFITELSRKNKIEMLLNNKD